MALTARARLADDLAAVVGPRYVLSSPTDVLAYEYDYGLDRAEPEAVVLPETAVQIAQIVRIARRHGVPVVPRGAGTGIAGGSVPVRGGIVVALTRMKRILEIDPDNRCAVVEPGVVNSDISKAAEPFGLFYAPDPSSQKASTIGGNVGNNAGGPHCLALGVTTNHVLGLEFVDAEGTVRRVGGKAPDGPGYDLTGLLVGSEGTLGIVTQVTVKLLRRPEDTRTFLAIFGSVDAASSAVSAIIARGILPAALELMDQLALRSIEAAFKAGFPPDAGAVLLIEIDGLTERLDAEQPLIEAICREHGATEIRTARDPAARARLWAARKGAASAMGRVAPNYYLHDTVVPRTKLPAVLRAVQATAAKYDLPIANLFHAGDGNLHPMILFDVKEPGVLDRVLQAGREILAVSVDAGGTISGEHGIGLEKNNFMPWIFSAADLEVMARVRRAFDPDQRFNPDKILPTSRACLDLFQRPPARLPTGDLWV